jgi:hypothetical protein
MLRRRALREARRAILARDLRDVLLRATPTREVRGTPALTLDELREQLARRGVAVSPEQVAHALHRLGVTTTRFGSRSNGTRARGVLLAADVRRFLSSPECANATAPPPLRAATQRANLTPPVPA